MEVRANKLTTSKPAVNKFIILAFVLIFVIFMTNLIVNNSQASLVTFPLFLWGVGTISSIKMGREERHLFNIIFFSNLFFIICIYFLYLGRYDLPYYIGGSDDKAYEDQAIYAAEHFRLTQYKEIKEYFWQSNSVGYTYFVSILYKISYLFGGFHTLIPRFFNGFVLAFISILTYKIAKFQLNINRSLAFKASLFVGLSPVMVFNSSHTFRDIIVCFLILLMTYLWKIFHKKKLSVKFLFILITIIAIVIVWEFRYLAAGFLILQILISWASSLNNKRNMKSIIFFFLVLMIIALLSLKFAHFFSLKLEQYYTGYTTYRLERTDGLASYIFSLPLIVGVLPRLLYLYITPFPVITFELERLMLSIGTVIQIFFFPYLILAVRKYLLDMKYVHIISGFIIIYISVAMLSFTIRHITLFYPFGVLLVACGLQYKIFHKRDHKLIFILMYLCVVSGSTLYLLLKFI